MIFAQLSYQLPLLTWRLAHPKSQVFLLQAHQIRVFVHQAPVPRLPFARQLPQLLFLIVCLLSYHHLVELVSSFPILVVTPAVVQVLLVQALVAPVVVVAQVQAAVLVVRQPVAHHPVVQLLFAHQQLQ